MGGQAAQVRDHLDEGAPCHAREGQLEPQSQAVNLPAGSRLYRVYDGLARKWRVFTGLEDEDSGNPNTAPLEKRLDQSEALDNGRIDLITPARHIAPVAGGGQSVGLRYSEDGDDDGARTEEYQRQVAVQGERAVVALATEPKRIKGFSRWPQVREANLMKPKKIKIGGDVVQDDIKTLETLLKKSMTNALLMATNRDFNLILSGGSAYAAKPVAGLQTKASV